MDNIILVLTTSKGVVIEAANPPAILPHPAASQGGKSSTLPVFDRR